jgi:type I restriction enzyme S subunit
MLVPLRDLLIEKPANGRSVPTLEGGFPVLRLTSIRDAQIDLAEFKLGAWSADQARPWLVREGDFLVGRGNGSLSLVGRGGLVPVVETAVAFPDTMIRLRVNPERCLGSYLSLMWGSPLVREQIERAARTTAGIYKISQGDLLGLQLVVPSLEEQRAVAAHLTDVLSRVRRAVADCASLRRRLDATDTALSLAFDQGTQVPLGQCLRGPLRNGKSAKAGAGTGLPVYSIGAVTNRDWSERYLKPTDITADEARGVLCEEGDVFIQRSNTPELVGSAALYKGTPHSAVFPDLLIRVQVDANKLLPAWLESQLKTPRARQWFKGRARGLAGSMPKISQEDILQFQVAVPPVSEQARMLSELDAAQATLELLRRGLHRAESRLIAVRRSALQAAFQGEPAPSTSRAE